MKKKYLIIGLMVLFIAASLRSVAQFHTMTIPKSSPRVQETQQLGVTDISIEYHSPAVRGRQVWEQVVPFDGDPIPWRAGANMNTRITFSTDVTINGNNLEAGSYGFHVIPAKDGNWTLLFASHDNQWGSYYLDRQQHVALEVSVMPVVTNFSEQLDYEYVDRTDSTLVIAVEWEEKRIPFTVGVDLNKTVIENFRYELLGINTYRWEAWNDAARWCLNRNTNLEEALEWADRSINGGFNGFAANKNFTNLATKADILWALNRITESDELYKESLTFMKQPGDAYAAGSQLASQNRIVLSLEVFKYGIDTYPDAWFLKVGYARSLYAQKNSKQAAKYMKIALDTAPESYQEYLQSQLEKINNGEQL